MIRLHPAQLRVLSFLALAPSGSFVSLVQIDRSRKVRPEDDLFIPSLIACGLAEIGPLERASVRITDAGRNVLSNPELSTILTRSIR